MSSKLDDYKKKKTLNSIFKIGQEITACKCSLLFLKFNHSNQSVSQSINLIKII